MSKNTTCWFDMKGSSSCSKKMTYANVCVYCKTVMETKTSISKNPRPLDKVGYGPKSDPNCIICGGKPDFVMGQYIICQTHYDGFKM